MSLAGSFPEDARMPERAADCHAHVFCGGRYPFAPDAVYVPHASQAGTAAQFAGVLEAHGLTHALLVAAQPYGYDNRCMLEAIAASDGRFKGIALVPAVASERELVRLAEAGVVGIRFNLSTYGMRELVEPGADRLLAALREIGWFLQIHYEKDELAEAAPFLRSSGVRLMIDHFGRPDVGRGIDQLGFRALLELGRAGNAVIKLSGPFRSSAQGHPFRDTDPFIAAAINAFGLNNCVWGSDWPFVRADERVDYGPGLACLPRWLPDPADLRRVLWDNPARLFGFS
jgi:predicted TIM-barrel fold metal-dependent hydrolase